MLVAASRSDHPHHAVARAWVERAVADAGRGLPLKLLSAPGVEQPAQGAEWPALRKLCADLELVANAVLDAWLAAAVIQQGEHLVSFDADFRRLLSRTQFTRLAV